MLPPPGQDLASQDGFTLALPAGREDGYAVKTKAWLSRPCQGRMCYLWAQAVWPGSLAWHRLGATPALKSDERYGLWVEVAAIQVDASPLIGW